MLIKNNLKLLSVLGFSLMLVSCTKNDVNASATLSECIRADMVLYNTKIYTANDAQWTAEATAVLGDKIIFVGTNAEAVNYMCGGAQIMNMAGKYVYAGFTDSHQHVEGVGQRPKTLSLFGIKSLKETVDAIKAFSIKVPVNEWVQGRGWIEREWIDEQRFLSKHDVDPFTSDKPLFMPRADGVSALVNSKALELAGITKDSPDPVGGKFERNADGTPNGYILASAMDIFRDIIPPKTREYKKDSLVQGMYENAKVGWTNTQDAGMPYVNVEIIKEIHAEGNMSTRIYAAANVIEAATMLKRGRETTPDNMFDLRGIKVYIDGTLGSRGAALLENYTDAQHNGFMNRTTKDDLDPILREALRNGIQIQTHVIGDRAVRSVLDWYEEAFNAVPKSEWAVADPRWRLEHVQIIPAQDQARLVSLGILPSMQPSHGIGDLNFAPDRLGPDRLGYAYPWQQLVDRGLMILGGSDAPVELGDPRIEFYAAIARKRLDGTSGEGWHPELAVNRETALKMFTIWPAYGAFQEDIRGSVEVGKYADFTIFDRDWLTVPEADILTSENLMTIVGGKITYQK
ncbi:amidohydrolase 3 [Glaciecola pallidula DSM 14239 = ACAM 615]|uniref:Amidohydrolase 3 n=1 Tax=Brumicola pallidula DSM 14239 = ACAM 615 TaxID=1121922 RepID=K6Y8T4_9ALTE|nr:amidohydrolase 3 [Glaciecola pallidula DSM 14239 = ACAM 615]